MKGVSTLRDTQRGSLSYMEKREGVVRGDWNEMRWDQKRREQQYHSLLEKCKSKPQWGTTSHQSECLWFKNLQAINAREGVEKREPSYTVGGNANWYNHYGKQSGDSLKKLQIELPYDPAIPLLGIHTEGTRIERDTCTPMFILLLVFSFIFMIASRLLHLYSTDDGNRCPSADEWIRKLWYIYTMEYYWAVRKNSFESVLMRWIKVEPIIQSEVSQKEKHQYSILTHIYGI